MASPLYNNSKPKSEKPSDKQIQQNIDALKAQGFQISHDNDSMVGKFLSAPSGDVKVTGTAKPE